VFSVAGIPLQSDSFQHNIEVGKTGIILGPAIVATAVVFTDW
jgi:hypothetical protein